MASGLFMLGISASPNHSFFIVNTCNIRYTHYCEGGSWNEKDNDLRRFGAGSF